MTKFLGLEQEITLGAMKILAFDLEVRLFDELIGQPLSPEVYRPELTGAIER
jgi:hypothetical protein